MPRRFLEIIPEIIAGIIRVLLLVIILEGTVVELELLEICVEILGEVLVGFFWKNSCRNQMAKTVEELPVESLECLGECPRD